MLGSTFEYLILLVRILITLTVGVYFVFAVLMNRQIGLMTKAVSMKDSGIITFLGYVHLIVAGIVLALALFLL